MVVSDEQRTFVQAFIDRPWPQELVISQNFSGHLVTHTDWPSILRNKGVFFVKREPEPLHKDNFMSQMTCGDIHPNALDHFCAWVEEVIAPILKLEKNLDKFPQCIADDIKRQVHELSTSVYQIRGYIKGRTLLPFPQVNIHTNIHYRYLHPNHDKMYMLPWPYNRKTGYESLAILPDLV